MNDIYLYYDQGSCHRCEGRMGGSCHCDNNIIGLARSCKITTSMGITITAVGRSLDHDLTTLLSLFVTGPVLVFGFCVNLLKVSWSIFYFLTHTLRTTETPLQHSCGFQEVLGPTRRSIGVQDVLQKRYLDIYLHFPHFPVPANNAARPTRRCLTTYRTPP